MIDYKYNEREYAKIIFEKGFQTDFIRYELVLLVRYLSELKYKKQETEEFIYKFCQKYISDFNEVLFYKTIDRAIKDGRKRSRKLIEIKSVDVYKEELEYIDKFNIDHNYKKLLLTFLIKKRIGMIINKINNPKKQDIQMSVYFDGSNRKFREVYKEANIINTKDQKYDINYMINELVDKEIFTSMIKGDIILKFLNKLPKGEEIFYSIPRQGLCNIGYVFDYYKGENNIKECNQCHVLCKVSNNRQQYCSNCWKEINKEQIKERVKKHRKVKNVTV